ncbi:MAG: response regulator [Ignavibacteriaceae bacterium]|nr:response regulator [Ignavibacteriaceae bacterium]
MKGKQTKLLVVEDNKETQLLIKVALRDDFDVRITDSADDAMLLLSENSFGLVLLDLNLNGQGNGKSILKNIREEMHNSELTVVITTAYDLSSEDKKYFEVNANGFVQKPFDKKILLNSIKQALVKN